jgi:hypothetical protein
MYHPDFNTLEAIEYTCCIDYTPKKYKCVNISELQYLSTENTNIRHYDNIIKVIQNNLDCTDELTIKNYEHFSTMEYSRTLFDTVDIKIEFLDYNPQFGNKYFMHEDNDFTVYAYSVADINAIKLTPFDSKWYEFTQSCLISG